jgi:hypothetical protein
MIHTKAKQHIPWTERAFKALDCENRGYLYKNELLDKITFAGVSSHRQLAEMI